MQEKNWRSVSRVVSHSFPITQRDHSKKSFSRESCQWDSACETSHRNTPAESFPLPHYNHSVGFRFCGRVGEHATNDPNLLTEMLIKEKRKITFMSNEQFRSIRVLCSFPYSPLAICTKRISVGRIRRQFLSSFRGYRRCGGTASAVHCKCAESSFVSK